MFYFLLMLPRPKRYTEISLSKNLGTPISGRPMEFVGPGYMVVMPLYLTVFFLVMIDAGNSS